MTNCAITAPRLYEFQPCQRIKCLRSLKLSIEKSDARAACLPSLPTIPTPICAFLIIATSFPPSPILRVILLQYLIIALTTFDFYFGDSQQHTTDSAFPASLKKNSSLYFIAVSNEIASTTKTLFSLFK